MHIWRHPHAHAPIPLPFLNVVGGSVVAIGNFDGVHKGHQEVLKAARTAAHERQCPLVVLTFEPHPKEVFAPHTPMPRLTSFAQKAGLLEEYGAESLYLIRFTKNFAATSAEDFISTILLNNLNAKHIFVGEDFRFGKKRTGDVRLLQKSLPVTAVPPFMEGDTVVSSGKIRAFLAAGEVEKAAEFLGRPFCLRAALRETPMLNMVAALPKNGRFPLKNGAYWGKIHYTDMPQAAVSPVFIKDGQLVVPPVADRPEVLAGRMTVEFLRQNEMMEALRAS